MLLMLEGRCRGPHAAVMVYGCEVRYPVWEVAICIQSRMAWQSTGCISLARC